MAKKIQPKARDHGLIQPLPELSIIQSKAALLKAQGLGATAIAKQLNVNPSTVWEWCKLPAFSNVVKLIIKEAFDEAKSSVLRLTTKALRSVEEVLDSPESTSRDKLTAASLVLKCLSNNALTFEAYRENPVNFINIEEK